MGEFKGQKWVRTILSRQDSDLIDKLKQAGFYVTTIPASNCRPSARCFGRTYEGRQEIEELIKIGADEAVRQYESRPLSSSR